METKDFNELKPDPKNPRKLSDHDGNALKNSMDKFGDLGAIVFNVRTQQLVGGHQRLAIMNKMSGERRVTILERLPEPDSEGTVATGFVWIGNKRFAYREVDFDEATQRAANIAANRIQGQFDLDLLSQVNYEIMQSGNGAELLELTGQTQDEIIQLANSAGLGEPDESQAPKEPSMILKVECESDQQMTELYNQLKKQGYNVKLS